MAPRSCWTRASSERARLPSMYMSSTSRSRSACFCTGVKEVSSSAPGAPDGLTFFLAIGLGGCEIFWYHKSRMQFVHGKADESRERKAGLDGLKMKWGLN